MERGSVQMILPLSAFLVVSGLVFVLQPVKVGKKITVVNMAKVSGFRIFMVHPYCEISIS